ncbi:MAG: UDP-glucose 4-epimerase GalE [Clostridia bacterium]|nr:UDP-glucose 4-epimerase GalE [Clostridia bacterium]
MAILVTGGAGYIGSHTCVELLKDGYDVIIVDNFYNSKPEALRRVKAISGRDFKFYECDILDAESLSKIFDENKIDSVIHFAGYKAVGESCQIPLTYYNNNITGTIVLCEVMAAHGCKNLVFSSSATVYGAPKKIPMTETDPVDIEGVTNPYGRTKLIIEEMLKDLYRSDNEWNIALLRYFNPIGAHESGMIGEDPNGIPNNLMPYISQVAIGKLEQLSVFGDDYPTHDGTGVRDYIHVVDLARGHVAALGWIGKKRGLDWFNLGTGVGYSVLDIVRSFEKVNGVTINYKIGPRRPGDIAVCYSDPTKAKEQLGWQAQRGIDEMCRDTWNWQKKNPNGFDNAD